MNTIINELSQVDAMVAWPEAEVYLRQAVTDDNPDNYLQQVQAFIFSGLHRLWHLVDDEGKTVAYAVTNTYSNDGIIRVAQLYLTTSTGMQELLSAIDQVYVLAIQRKVDYIEIIGRKGWEKVLRPYGFTHNHTSLIKRINRELH